MEEQLKESEERIRLSIEAAALGTWDLDLKTDVAVRSLRHDQIWGYTELQPEWGLGIAMRNVVPEDRSKIENAYERGIKTGVLYHENRIIYPNGKIRWIRAFGHFKYDDESRPIRVMGVVEDITERKKAEEALEAERARLHAVLDSLPIAVWIADQKGTVIQSNRAIEQIWGEADIPYGIENYKKFKGWWADTDKSIEPEDWALARAVLKGEVSTGEVIDIERFNGERATILNNAAPVKDHAGRIIGGVAVAQDITKRIKAEQELRESEEKFRTVFEQAAVGIGRISFDDARWIEVNEAFCRMLGYTREEMLSTPWPQMTHPEDVDLDLIPFSRMAEGELDSYTVEKRFIHNQGHNVWARLTLSLVRDFKGLPHYEIAVIENISDKKKAEEKLLCLNENLEQKVDERTRIAEARSMQLQALAVELIEAEERERRRIAQVLHDDLQQMLAGTRLMLQSVSESLPPLPEIAEVQQLLEESIKKSRSLSHELSPAVLHHSGLVAALEWLIGQMKTQFSLNVELENKTDISLENAPIKVFAFRAVQELLFNIVKHAGVTSARVEISNSIDNYFVTVSDKGNGFAPEALNRHSKVGFGLLTIRERADYIGARFVIDSAPGQGSRFTLKIPINIVNAKGPQPQTAAGRIEQLEIQEMPAISPAAGVMRGF
jgi:PAS domain S-box-containing protein